MTIDETNFSKSTVAAVYVGETLQQNRQKAVMYDRTKSYTKYLHDQAIWTFETRQVSVIIGIGNSAASRPVNPNLQRTEAEAE